MNFQFYLEKLYASEIFKKFMEDSKDAFPTSGFFVIDKEGLDNKQHIDYYIPSDKKLFSFQLESGCDLVPVEIIDGHIPQKIAMNYNFDFDDVEALIQIEMVNKGMKGKIQKFLFSLQNKDGKDYLVGTIFLSGFGLLKVNVDISKMEITHFEKKSFFDMLRITKNKKEDKQNGG